MDENLLQDILKAVKQVGETVDRLDHRMESLETRMESLETRMESMEQGLEIVKIQVAKNCEKTTALQSDVTLVKERVDTIHKELLQVEGVTTMQELL